MKLKKESFNDLVIGAEQELNFSIDDNNSIIFDILRDKMYSNKIGSLCREVISNSRDANREAGRADVPVEVEIAKPNKFTFLGDMSIIFRDNGIGISPDRMADVFVKYAASTKRNTNGQTGGFGLGAKTPFAYTDTFTVITTCNVGGKRIKYHYTAMIDSSRKGKMIMFDSEETTENTGTQIIVPIKSDDRETFEYEVIKSTLLWKTRPTLINFIKKVPEINRVIDEKSFSIIEKNSYIDGDYYIASVDGIMYPLNTSLLKINKGVGNSMVIELKLNTGDITLAANREAIQYDDDTVEKLKQINDEVKQYLSKSIKNYISGADKYITACYRYNGLFGQQRIDDAEVKMYKSALQDDYWVKGILSGMKSSIKKQQEWNGKKITGQLPLKYHKAYRVAQPQNGEKVSYVELTNNITNSWFKLPIYYADVKRNIRRNITIWENKGDFILLQPKPGVDIKQQADEQFELVHTFDLDIELFSTVEKAENNDITTYSAYKPTSTITIKFRQYNQSSWGSSCWESDRVELHREKQVWWDTQTNEQVDAKFAYVIVDRLTSLNNSCNAHTNHKLIEKFSDYELIAINQRTYDRYFSTLPKSMVIDADELVKQIEKRLQKRLVKYALDKQLTSIFTSFFGYGSKVQQMIKLYPELLPKSMRHIIENDFKVDNQLNGVKIDDIKLKFDFKGLRTKIQKRLDDNSMLYNYIRTSNDSIEKMQKEIKKYQITVA